MISDSTFNQCDEHVLIPDELNSYEDRIRFIRHHVFSDFYIVFGDKYIENFCDFILDLIHRTYVSPIFEKGHFIELKWNGDEKNFNNLFSYIYQHRCDCNCRQADFAGALGCLFHEKHASQYVSMLKYYHPKDLSYIYSEPLKKMEL
jgi:hypothetical protein